jgi:hypothetical protein
VSNKERKELLRLLIKDVVLLRCKGCIKVTIRWQTGARYEVEAPWPNYVESHQTDAEIVDIIRRLALTHTDEDIAEYLNRHGYRSLRGKRFYRLLIVGLRCRRGIPKVYVRRMPAGLGEQSQSQFYTVSAAAQLLGVAYSCVHSWCRRGKVEFIQSAPHALRWVKLTEEDVVRLKQSAPPRKQSRRRDKN